MPASLPKHLCAALVYLRVPSSVRRVLTHFLLFLLVALPLAAGPADVAVVAAMKLAEARNYA